MGADKRKPRRKVRNALHHKSYINGNKSIEDIINSPYIIVHISSFCYCHF